MNQIRQGDVLLLPVKELPANLTEVERDSGRLVLAYGEGSGHAHVIDAPVSEAQLLADADGARFLRIMERAFLVHAGNLSTLAPVVPLEHAAIEIEPGLYRQIPQEEWSDAMEPRRVVD